MAETTESKPSPVGPPPAVVEHSEPASFFHDAAAWIREHKLYTVLAVICLVFALFWVFTGDINPNTDDAQVDGHAIVISPRVPGYVSKMLIDDNTVVKAGDLMIQLDPADYQAKADQAQAALEVAAARAASLKITVPFTQGTTSNATLAASAQVQAERSELESAKANFQRLSTSELKFAEANIAARKAQLDKADADVKRTRSLADDSEISRQQFDAYLEADGVARNEWLAAQERLDATKREAEAASAAQDTAKSRIAQGEAQVKGSKAQELQAGVRKADYQSALADVEQARAILKQALLNLGYTRLLAPVDAVVTRRTVEQGQQFSVGQPMFTLVPLNDIWVTANLKETQMAHVRPGQKVKIDVDTYGHKTLYGTVDSIASSTGSRQALLPPENATGNFVKVVQRIPVKIRVHQDAKDGEILRPGMNVEVKIMTGSWF
jgi:membrane fusion protein (multidrug efflux system)